MKKLTKAQAIQRDAALKQVMAEVTRHFDDCEIHDGAECDCDGEINGGDLIEHIGFVRERLQKIINGRK